MDCPLTPEFRKIAVIAPAGRSDTEKTALGLRILSEWGIEAALGASVTNPSSPMDYLAASAEPKADELSDFLLNSSVDAVMAVRGGYGSAHALPHLDWNALEECRKPVIGYSDLTALLCAMHSFGVGRPVWGPMVESLPAFSECPDTMAWMRLALGPLKDRGPQIFPFREGRKLLRAGSASGPAVPATLSVLETLLGTCFMPALRGAVLILEDVNEPVYKLDRFLTHLRMSRVLDGLSGLVFGDFKDCEEPERRERLFIQFAESVSFPVAMGLPFGHGLPCACVAYGADARITSEGISIGPIPP